MGYVGDGLNDVPAMQAADLSIVVSRHALGSSQADMVVNELRQIGSLPPICHRIRMNHIQGVSFSLLYNIVMIGLSALVFPVYDKTIEIRWCPALQWLVRHCWC